MPSIVLEIFLWILGVLGILASLASFVQGGTYKQKVRRSLDDPNLVARDLPPVQILLPCRGIDPGLKENLLAVLSQDYPDYRVLFLVDSEEDRAVPIINEAIDEANTAIGKLHLVDQSLAPTSSGKVRALIGGMHEIPDDREVIVTADSDIRPRPDWLLRLVSNLFQDGVGASTTYRWYFSDRDDFWSVARSEWNAVFPLTPIWRINSLLLILDFPICRKS